MQFTRPSTILVTGLREQVDLLGDEISSLGYTAENTFKSSITLSGTMHDAMGLNLHLRTAMSVLFLLDTFTARDPDALYRHVKQINWEDIIPADELLTVTSRVDHPTINNSMFPSLRVKDAIVDRIREQTGRRPDAGADRSGVVVALYWSRNHQAHIYLNTSGARLSDRGYRKRPHSAPLQETLAASLLLRSGYDGTQPLVIPMCGSGTLAIEGALIGMRRAAGALGRDFAFEHLVGFDREELRALRRSAKKQMRKSLPHPIIATDIDPAAVDAAKHNAKTAGVDHLIRFNVCDFADTEIPPAADQAGDTPGGVVIVNPEYGRRLGDTSALRALYARLGDFFKQQCPGYRAMLITGDRTLAKEVHLRATSRTPVYNGDIECRLLRYDMYAGTRA